MEALFDASEAIGVFNEFASKLENEPLQDIWYDVIQVAYEAFNDNFESTKAPSGFWPPHAPSTVAKYGPHPLLILEGFLLQSVTKSGSWGNIENIQPRLAEIGTDIPYAAVQNYGGGNIPARRYLWADSLWVDKMNVTFADGITKILGVA